MLTDLQVRLSVDNEENIENLPLLDRIINEKGYASIHQWKIITFTFLAISLEGMHFNILGMILIPLKHIHSLEDIQIQFISAIMMVSVGIGSFLCGHIINRFPRIRTIKYTILATFILHFLMGCFTHNLIMFVIIRILLGFVIGVFIPLITNLLCEYCPIHHRSFVFNATWMGYNVGCLFFAYSQLYIMPNLEEEYLSKTIIFTSILPLFVFIILKIYLKDSPRNLIILHREEEAFEVLEVFKGSPIDEKDRNTIIQDVKHGINKEMHGHFSDLFTDKYKFMTIVLMFLWFTVYMLYYGPFLILSWVIRDINHSITQVEDNRKIILDEIHVYSIGIIGYLVGGVISEMRLFGRKNGIIFALFFCIVFTYLGILDPKNFVTYFGIYFIFLNTPLIVVDVYSCELYPTKIRDIAVGFFFACCRFGSCIANIIYVSLYRMGTFVPFWIVIITCVLDICLSYLVPYETFGMALDTDHDYEKNKSFKSLKETMLFDFKGKEEKEKI